MNADLKNTFGRLKLYLESIDGIRFEKYNFNILDLNEKELNENFSLVKDLAELELPGELKNGIEVQNNIEVVWEENTTVDKTLEDKPCGEFYLEEFISCMLKPSPDLYNKSMPLSYKEILVNTKIIDDQRNYGNGRLVLLRIIEDPSSHELWYFHRGEFFRMGLTYSEYLMRLSQTIGFYDWQFFFCQKKDLLNSKYLYFEDDILNRMKLFLDFIPPIFPDTDYQEYRDIYHQYQKSD